MTKKEKEGLEEIKRMQCELSVSALNRIDELVDLTDTKTRTAYSQTCYALMEWAVKQMQAGRVIFSEDMKMGDRRELHSDALEAVRRKTRIKDSGIDVI